MLKFHKFSKKKSLKFLNFFNKFANKNYQNLYDGKKKIIFAVYKAVIQTFNQTSRFIRESLTNPKCIGVKEDHICLGKLKWIWIICTDRQLFANTTYLYPALRVSSALTVISKCQPHPQSILGMVLHVQGRLWERLAFGNYC